MNLQFPHIYRYNGTFEGKRTLGVKTFADGRQYGKVCLIRRTISDATEEKLLSEMEEELRTKVGQQLSQDTAKSVTENAQTRT